MGDGSVEGRGGPALVRAVEDGPGWAAEVLADENETSIEDLELDFFTALAMSNRERARGRAPANPCFGYLPTTSDPVTEKQRGTNTFAQFHGQAMTGPKVQAFAAPDGRLRYGGVEYLELGGSADVGVVGVDVTTDVRSAARIRIGRVK